MLPSLVDPGLWCSACPSPCMAGRRRGKCCGNACRHCPYDHINVPGRRNRSTGERPCSDCVSVGHAPSMLPPVCTRQSSSFPQLVMAYKGTACSLIGEPVDQVELRWAEGAKGVLSSRRRTTRWSARRRRRGGRRHSSQVGGGHLSAGAPVLAKVREGRRLIREVLGQARCLSAAIAAASWADGTVHIACALGTVEAPAADRVAASADGAALLAARPDDTGKHCYFRCRAR